MTDTILIGIDGSKAGEHAVNFAVSQAKSGNTRLVLGYVVEWSPYTFNTPEENEQRHLRRKEEIKTARREC
jgi:nucleotide-binding universal stress UspA family protein